MEKSCDNCLYALHNSNCNTGEESIYCTKGVIEVLTENDSVCEEHVFEDETMKDDYVDTSKVLSKETFIKLMNMFDNVELWKMIRDNIDDDIFQRIINLKSDSQTISEDVDSIIKLRLSNKKNNR